MTLRRRFIHFFEVFYLDAHWNSYLSLKDEPAVIRQCWSKLVAAR